MRARELRPADCVVTHTLPLEKAPAAYTMFNDKKDGVVKVILQPPHQAQASSAAAAGGPEGDGQGQVQAAAEAPASLADINAAAA